ncbi:hypothetical protein CRN55_06740 [Vibrio vulnificus]|nr:hypothetical protein CRN55_06740 [Vibrio vulnificus]
MLPKAVSNRRRCDCWVKTAAKSNTLKFIPTWWKPITAPPSNYPSVWLQQKGTKMKKTLTTLALLLASSSVWAEQQCLDGLTPTASNARFSYSDLGTVTDKQTGLTWMRCAVGQQWNQAQERCEGEAQLENWQSALQTAQAVDDENANHALFNFAGKRGWRMANIKELVSLTEAACHSPSLNARAWGSAYTVELGNLAVYIWSNTPSTQGASALSFDSANGEVYHHAQTQGLSVLLVTEQ